MRLLATQLTNFRNIAQLRLDWAPGWHLILGDNGQGKTNLLESLVFLSNGRSNRTPRDAELVRHDRDHASTTPDDPLDGLVGSPSTVVEATFEQPATQLQATLKAVIRGGAGGERVRTQFSLDGKPYKSRSQAIGQLPTVSFFSRDLMLLRGEPADRRQWLDTAVAQWRPDYVPHLQTFQHVLKQRNELLHQVADTGTLDQALFDILTRQYLSAWQEVLTFRHTYLDQLAPLAAAHHATLSESHDGPLTVAYQTRLKASPLPPRCPAEERAPFLEQELSLRFREECRRGITVAGPHKDDVDFLIGDWSAITYGSQGQQRSVVLALKIAELELLSQRLNSAPLLLLDDVMAELDPGRQTHLLTQINTDAQVFLTTTHLADTTQKMLIALLSDRAPLNQYTMQQGVLTKLSP